MTQADKMDNLISIGELARLTGITTHTLRVWEKRYGTPHAQRLPSGHRRYPKEDVPRLRAIAKALESGYRASKVVSGTLEELQGLMGLKPFISSDSSPESAEEVKNSSNETLIERWVKGIHEFDDDSLLQGFHEQWNRVGPLTFITDFTVPLIERIGTGWESGELTISHEHFATECLSSFLTGKWRQLNSRKEGWAVLLATLPGETHNLGLLMSAVVASLSGAKVIYLGLDTPVEDMITTANKYNPKLLCLSISCCQKPMETEDSLFKIRNGLGKNIKIVAGGKGTPEHVPGIRKVGDFNNFNNWLMDFENNLQPSI
ncbi:MAG: MerR family transcriptional regulator [Nitrospina sp.]|jgi:MerR family transcriptional regulator, light-induced transcriptional regulator|nr:MerR family transcriptional regulator [Nitrospina sp.]MBT6718513.1 MerR family transcriptional regulator [Nitrospina sp.]